MTNIFRAGSLAAGLLAIAFFNSGANGSSPVRTEDGSTGLGSGSRGSSALPDPRAGALAFGLALGLTGAFALTRVIGAFLYGVSSTDPLTYIGVSVSLTVGALIASLIPARRAISVDPTVALRYE